MREPGDDLECDCGCQSAAVGGSCSGIPEPPRLNRLEHSNQSRRHFELPEIAGENGLILKGQNVAPLDFREGKGFTPEEPVTLIEGAWRHSGWAGQRLKVWKEMQAVGLPNSRLLRFANCGSGAWVEVCESTGADGSSDIDCRTSANTCHDRFCVPCGASRAFAIFTALQERITGKSISFVTLTLRADGKPLKHRLDRLYQSFSKLRRRSWWQSHINGGAAFCECTTGKTPGNWHVHLHLLLDCGWLVKQELSDEWKSASGDSFIVDVKRVDGTKPVSHYITKYVTKPATKEVYDDPDKLHEMILAFSGRRLCLTFGNWRGTPLKPKAPSKTGWRLLCRLEQLLTGNFSPDSVEARVLRLLMLRNPTKFSNGVPP